MCSKECHYTQRVDAGMLAVMLYECVDCHTRNPGPLHCCCNTNFNPSTTYGPTYSPAPTPKPVIRSVSIPTPVNRKFNLPSFPSFPSFPSLPSFGFRKCKKEGHQLVDLHRFDKPEQLSDCDIRMGCMDCGKVSPGHLHCCC